jgi:PAS domain S-box-containing protein
MDEHSEEKPDWESQRNRIIGLGETSHRKSYYPELQQRILEMDKKNRELQAAYAEQTAVGEELRQQFDETAKKEQELRESEQRFRSLIEASPVPIMLAREGVFLYTNSAFSTMVGYDRHSDIAGKKLLEFIAPEFHETVAAYIHARSYGDPAPLHYESIGIRRDGSRFPYEITVAVIDLSDGPVTMAFVTDITERKRSEEAVVKSGERLRRAELVAGLGHWEFDLEAGSVYASEGARSLYGLSKEYWSIPEVQKIPLLEYRSLLDDALRALTEENRPYDIDFKIRRPTDGKIVDIHSIAEYDPEKRIVFGVIQDITKLKQAEESLQKSAATLSSIFRAAPIGIGLVSNRVLLRVNDTLCQMTGYTRDELVGKSARILYPSDEEFDLVGKEKYEQIQRIGTGTVETRWMKKDGTIRNILLSSTPLDPANLVAGVTFTALDFTDRRAMEDALRESEEKFRNIVETSPDLIWETDVWGRFTYISSPVVEMLGYPPEDLTGKSFLSLLPEDQISSATNAFEHQVSSMVPHVSLDVTARHNDGHLLSMEIRSSLVKNEQGNPTGFRGIARDITEQKRQHHLLSTQLNLGLALQVTLGLKETLDACLSAAIEIAEMDAGGIYLIDKITGAADLTISRNLSDEFVQHISHYPADSANLQMIMEGKPLYVSYRKTGVVHTPVQEREGLRAIGIIPIISGGRPIACINVTSHTLEEIPESGRVALETIALQIGAAIERIKSGEELKISEERYRSLVDVTDTGYLVLDNKGRVVDANEVYVRLTGRESISDIIGRPVTEWTAPYDLERNAREVEKCIKTGSVRGFEVDYIRPDGTLQPIELNASVFSSGGDIAILTLCRDISDRKQSQVALQQARNKLNLLNTVTFQDIQTSAFSLSAYQELIKTVLTDAKARSYVDKQQLFLKKMVDTLDFARNYQEMGIHPPRWQNVRQVFLYAISHLDFLHMKQDLQLDTLEIFADPLFEKALFNIMENVLNHGVSATEVKLWYEVREGNLTLIIGDNGVGISPAEKNMIFDRGYGKGTGLGLFLVREVLSITGMGIRETGIPGQGTRFEINVPKGAYRFTDKG